MHSNKSQSTLGKEDRYFLILQSWVFLFLLNIRVKDTAEPHFR